MVIMIDDLFLLLQLLLLIVVIIISVSWIAPFRMKRKLEKNGFNGPQPVFPWGNIKEMRNKSFSTSSSSSSLHETINHNIHASVFPYFSSWKKTFGNVFVYWLGTEPFLYVGDPEFLKKSTYGNLYKNWGKPSVFKRDRKPMFGKGLVMADGDDWAFHRKIIAPAFSMTNLNVMISSMVETTSTMIEEWSKLVAGGHTEINVEKYVTRNAAEVIAKTSFGISQDKGKQVFEKLQAMQSLLFNSNRPVGVPFSRLMQPVKSFEEWKLGQQIDRLLLSMIESRACNAELTRTNNQQDLLGLLLARRMMNGKIERKLTARELVDECKTFFFGGHETTALALTWTLLLLALHPEWQQSLREEIKQVCGDNPPEFEMLSRLIKMGWVMNEVLRLYPPAPNLQRQAKEDILITTNAADDEESTSATIIPKGTNMWIDVVAMHHDESLWGEDANEFKPERFKNSSSGGCSHRMGFLPFGFGGRMCVGRNLTMVEYKIVLSMILRKFSISVSPEYRHRPRIMLSLRPSHGIPLILQMIEENC